MITADTNSPLRSCESVFSRCNSSQTPVSEEVTGRSRKNLSVILQKLGAVGQVRMAEGLGVSEATVSRWKDKDGELERIALVLALLGLQVAPADAKLYPPDQIDALLVLVRGRLNNATGAESFFGSI